MHVLGFPSVHSKMSAHVSRVFQVLQKEFLDNVSLSALVPELNGSRLLTDAEEQKLTNESVTHYDRVMQLTAILRRKGPDSPNLVVQCLRREGGPGHVHLADCMERYLSERGAQHCQRGNPTSVESGRCHSDAAPGCGPSSLTPVQEQGSLPIQCSDPHQHPDVVTQAHIQSHPLPTCPSEPPPSMHPLTHPSEPHPPVLHPSPSAAYHPPPSPSSSHSVAPHPPSPSLPSPSYPPIQERTTVLPFSNEYNTMIGGICTSLATRGISSNMVVRVLQELFQSISVFLHIPPQVTDLPSLLELLRSQRMCHECDVDLLCKILRDLQQNDLHQEVTSYAHSIMHYNVLSCQLTNEQPQPDHFLTFTIHNLPSLTFAQACEVKDVLSDILGVGRHTFWLSSSEMGSVVLVWSFRREISKHVHETFENVSIQGKLLSSHMHHIVCIQTLHQDSVVRLTVFTAPPEQAASSQASSSHPVLSRASLTCGDSPFPLHTHSTSTYDHFREEGEVMFSSTTTDSPESQPAMETTYPKPGTKRRPSTNSPQYEAYKRVCRDEPTTKDSSSIFTHSQEESEPMDSSTTTVERDSPKSQLAMDTTYPKPGTKRRLSAGSPQHESYKQACRDKPTTQGVRETTPQMFSDMTPTEFSRQYIPRKTRTPTHCEPAPEPPHKCILKENQPFLVEHINLMSLLPHLNAQQLLSDVENEELQIREVTEHDRIIRLLTILQKKRESGFQRFLVALEQASDHTPHHDIAERLKDCSSGMPPALPSSSPTAIIAGYLRSVYTGQHFFQRAAGPRFGDIEFIRLALVKKQGVSEEDRWKDKFLKATLHGLVEDIAKKKSKLDMGDIFKYGKKTRKLVLVEGAPGVGKTMLAMKLCQSWAEGELLKEYDVVLLVELRRFQGATKLKWEDLIGVHLEGEIATKVTQHFMATGGKKLLIILEGWDELSPKLRREFSFFFDLIKGDKLPNASIMVTSRPSVTAPLYDYMDERRVEVLGFSEDQQDEYIQKNVPDSELAGMVLDHLKQFPNLRALAHIPLTLAIICSVATKCSCLPVTLTELYGSYTCNALFQNLKKKPDEHFQSLSGLSSLDDIPKDAQRIITALCKLALQGMKQKSFIFKCSDLESAGIDVQSGFDAFGLLSTTQVSATAGHEVLYQFRHLSIHEFLAALEIKSLPVESRLQLLEEFRSDRQFQNVWKFLAGITKLQDDTFREMIINTTRQSIRDQLFLLHCLYEAQNADICKEGAEKIHRHLNLGNVTLNATDCLCAAYMVGCTGGEWEVDLRGCNIGGDGLEVIKKQLGEQNSPHLKITELDLMHNHLTRSDVNHLTEILCDLEVKIVSIDLGSNRIGDEGVMQLAEALHNNTIVEQIHFSHCNLTSESGRLCATMLKHNNTLKNLFLGFEPLGDQGAEYLASALKENNTLEELSLSATGLTQLGLSHVVEALKTNKSLKIIRFDRNQLGPAVCQRIAEIVMHNDTLDQIDLTKNPIGDEGFCTLMDALIAKPGTLKKLGVYGCRITGKGLHNLAEFFKRTDCLKSIQLGLNPLGDEGAQYIAEGLHQNTSQSVKDVFLEHTNMSAQARHMLEEICQSREDLNVTFTKNASVEKWRKQRRSYLI